MKRKFFDWLSGAQPPLPLPAGMSPEDARSFLDSIRVEHGSESEMQAYCRRDWRRFLYTWSLVKDLRGDCLELGASPYFTTGLLREFTQLRLSLANFFGPSAAGTAEQRVKLVPSGEKEPAWITMGFHQFNVETDRFPYEDASFDVLLFCEIIEHLQTDPLQVMKEIKRVLKPDGILVLTTPNVARLDNRLRLLAGKNINDRYSGYGPYGRHNREYTRDEIDTLLSFCGFDPKVHFTANVHFSRPLAGHLNGGLRTLLTAIRWSRADDLGQYIFVSARNARPMQESRPAWLFRSFSN